MDNRNKILECSLDLFYQKGYDSVGIQEICQEAGITKPTLYHYFGSKLGLLESVLKEKYTYLCERLEEIQEKDSGIENSLKEYLDVLFTFAQTNPKAYMLLMALSYSAKESEGYLTVKPYLIRIYTLAVMLFENASKQLGNMNGRQKEFAIGFLGLINHYIMFLGYQKSTNSINEISEEKKMNLLHQFMYGIWT